MRTERPLAAASAVYDQASAVYWQAFGPLAAMTGVVALAFNFVVFVSPSLVIYAVPWGLLVNFVGVTMLSSALLVPMVASVRSRQGADTGTPIGGVREHGCHIAATTFLMLMVNAVLIVTFIGIALAVFLTVRLAFIAVSSVLEDQDVTDSLARSWDLTNGVWMRTAGVLLGAVAPFVMLLLIVALVDWPWIAVALITAVGEALVVPFVVAVTVVMFDEYRALHPEPDDFGPRRH